MDGNDLTTPSNDGKKQTKGIYDYFSRIYDFSTQQKFVREIEEGNFSEATETLEKLASAQTVEERVLRLKIQMEGYRMLFKYNKTLLDKELTDYKELGKLEEISEKLGELEIWENLGDYDFVRAIIDKRDELEQALDNLKVS